MMALNSVKPTADKGHGSGGGGFDDHEDDHGDHGGPHVHEEHEGGHDEPWLVSYADMMTLLFGFFVIMYSFASAKNSGEESDLFKMKKELAVYFGGEYINPVDKVAEAVRQAIEKANVAQHVKVMVKDDMLELVMQSSALFESGSAEIVPEQLPLVGAVLDVMFENKLVDYGMIVEGHTDDVPIATRQYRSNWDLSASRAATVAKMLQERNFDTNKLSVRAFGEFKPIAPNRDPAGVPIDSNRARNRRIVIKLVADKK